MAGNYETPGVYIQEINAFPNSVVPIPTAVPAFIGYTPCAEYQGKSYYNRPHKISSYAEFQAIYMLPDPVPPADPAKQYNPAYYLVQQKAQPTVGHYMSIGGQFWSILPDPSTVYHLYNAVRLFYQNGGGDAYIVAVGTYGAASKKSLTDPGARAINSNIQPTDLKRGLQLLLNETEPTMYVCPDATMLSNDDSTTFMQEMLAQAAQMQTVVCLFDVIGGLSPDPIMYHDNDIQPFRNSVGNGNLKYGIAYYPYIGTTIMQSGEIDFTNLFGGDAKQLLPFVNPPTAPNADAATIVNTMIAKIQDPMSTTQTNSQLNAALVTASDTYAQVLAEVTKYANILPPSGGIAGVYATNDSQLGVWNSPANMSIIGAVSLPIRLSDAQQQNLNVDAITGKSINAIRFFNGQGILIWGARTLDGNSQDWRYISVRRTMTFLEQSVKAAARAYVFEPNDANTWAAVKSMINSFLTDVWKQGGLQGAVPADAFTVDVGLGTTMTADDLLNGYMRVTVRVAVVRPAEFIVLTFQQKQATTG